MSMNEMKTRLESLLSEPHSSAVERETSTLDSILGSLDQPFLLFGAGNLGRKALNQLKGIGKKPVAFIDNNPHLWGTKINAVPIMSPAEAASIYDPSSTGVITTIWCGEATDKMEDRIGPIRTLGFSRVAMFGHLAWKFREGFLPHYCLDRPSKVIDAADRVIQAFSLLSDESSRKLFVDHVEWRLFLNYDLLPPPSDLEIYFNDQFVSQSPTEVLYDIGAYTGDSVESFLRTSRGLQFSEIHSFEPSPSNFLTLNNYFLGLREIPGKAYAHQLALGGQEGSILVEQENGPASRVGKGNFNVPISTIDIFSESHLKPSFIKIDIEGFELECLRGAEQTIRNTGPVVAVSVYHLQDHLWEIVLQLNSYRPDYSFYLCPHVADGWDLVLYAVPPARAAKAGVA
jgi:FkbM family methyltransferase